MPFRCPTSAPRRSLPLGSASSRRLSPWLSECGGSIALKRAERAARKAAEGYGDMASDGPVVNEMIRENATSSGEFDPAEILHGKRSTVDPAIGIAVLPLIVVIAVNFLMSLVVLPRLDF